MKVLIYILKFILKLIYSFFKLFPINNKKVVFISRESNDIPLDFKLLANEILKLDNDYKTIFLCKMIEKNCFAKVMYFFSMLKQMYHIATSRVCIVDTYCLVVSLLNHKNDLIVIQLWHALAAIKKFGYQSIGKKYGRGKEMAELLNMHKNYDYVISGSEAMIPIFSSAFNVDESKFKAIGTPKIDYLLHEKDNIRKKIESKYPNLTKKKVILYVPTFRKDRKININSLLNTVNFNKYNVVVKLHPLEVHDFKSDLIYECKDFSSFEMLTIADYVITDYSAISIEATILDKPLYFYVYDIVEYKEKNGLNIDLNKEMKGCCFEKFEELYKKLDSGNYNVKQLQKFKNKYLTNQNGNSGYILANFIVNGSWISIDDNKTLFAKYN